ncbi:MAG: hypothetical protein M5U34_32400 [Chloroflexi bacterium]|nr:hypothetical protein [Chloroflexota bacterium]
MIPLTLALELKEAGLKWIPDLNDFFAIPYSDLDDRLFVMADMLTAPRHVERLAGHHLSRHI